MHTVRTLQEPVLFVAGPARSGITAMAEACALALGVPQRDVSADLARVALLGGVDAAAARRFAEIGQAAPAAWLSPRLVQAVLEDFVVPGRGREVLRAAEWLPEAAILPGLRRILPHLPRAKVILLHRDGVAAVSSRLRAKNRLHFVQHCLSWASAMEAGASLHAAYPKQVMRLAHRDILATPEASLKRLSAFAGWDAAAAERMRGYLASTWPERSGIDPGLPGPGLADVAWSTPEKQLFVEICGDAMRAAGYSIDDAAALVRRAPLSLADLAASGRFRVQGIAPAWPATEPDGTLRLTATTDGTAIAVCHGVAPAGRQHLTGRLRALPRNAPGFRVRLDVLGTLTREPVLSETFELPAGTSTDLDRRLRHMPEMIDMVVSVASGQAIGQGLDLCDFTLSLG